MQTFGKTLRNCLPALGLGLIGALGVASVGVLAPAAMAQNTAKKEFVENFNAASAALKANRLAEATQKADAAWPHAANTQQKSALEQIRVGAACAPSVKAHAGCISAIEKAKGTGGLPNAVVKNYDQMLAGRYAEAGNGAKALQQTKDNIAKYGGSQTELAFVARKELEAKNYAGAVTSINKAIAAGKPTSTHYNILLNAYAGQNKMDDYYKTLERIAPSMGNEQYWRMLIERARKEPNYRASDADLDVFRALDAAKVKLKSEEMFQYAEAARKRGLAIEAAAVWDNIAKTDAALVTKNKALVDNVKKQATTDKASGLAASEAAAASRASGEPFRDAAEAYMANANYTKAIELFDKSIAKGEMDAGKVDFVKLRKGIAQFKGGKKADATKTWQSIKADNGAGWLAKSWLAVAK